MVWAGSVSIAGGVAVLWVGWLAAGDRLPRNGWAGIRTLTTLRDDETWFAAHRAGARWLLASGALAVLGGAVTLLLSSNETAGIAVLIVGGLGCGILAIVAGVLGHLAARRVVAARTDG